MESFTKALTSFLLFISCSGAFAQGLDSLGYDYLPPCPDTVNNRDAQYLGQYHQNYGGIVDLQDPIHYNFQNCFPPPQNVGENTTHSFWSTAIATVHLNGVTGVVTFTMNAPALVTVKVIKLSEVGTLRTFSNEMTQLDISGGNLPAGTMIRESPTKATTGFTTIELVDFTSYTINSYFDVWTELSFDTGATWIPCDTSGRMTLSDQYYSVGVSEHDDDFNFTLSPNPFPDVCYFSFSVLNTTDAKLEVFDLNGKLVSTVLNETVQPGKQYRVEFKGSALPDGVYISKFTSGNNSIYKRIVMMK